MPFSADFAPELIRQVCLPAPKRSRPDERVVELVLAVCSGGAFAGRRLACERVRIGPFRKYEEHERELGELAERLERDPELDQPGRQYRLVLDLNGISKLLRRHREAVHDALNQWAVETWPDLPLREKPYRFSMGIPLRGGKRPRIDVQVEASPRAESVAAVVVNGHLRDDADRLRPVLERALRQKLPKLARADVDHRMLIVEKSTPEVEEAFLQTVLEVAEERRAWAEIDCLVLADTRALDAEGILYVHVWDVKGGEWSEHVEVCIGSGPPDLLWSRTELATLQEQAQAYVAAAKSKNTLRAYDADWRDFCSWCSQHDRSALPAEPETVALYLADRAGTLKTSSLSRRLTAIARRHQALGLSSPSSMQHAQVSEVWKGIQRTKGTAQRGKTPLLTAQLRQVLEALPDNLQGVRDCALLLTGFAGGFRRSELAGLEVADLKDTEQGIVITLRRSKTDPNAEGRSVALPYGSDPLTCPVRAVRTWLEQAGITEGPLFRAVDQFDIAEVEALHPDSVAYIVKRAVERVGLNVEEFAGHSLRAGLATQAAMNGASELAIMKQTGHRSLATVRKYIREGSLFRDNAATKLGL